MISELLQFKIYSLIISLIRKFFAFTFVIIAILNSKILIAQTGTHSLQGSSSPSLPTSLRGNGLNFTPNKGQVVDMNQNLRPDILFKAESGYSSIYLRKGGISYVLSDADKKFEEIHEALEEKEKTVEMSRDEKNKFRDDLMEITMTKIHRIDIDFIGGNTNYKILQEDQIDGHSNYYLSHCPAGITSVNSYNKITGKDIYPNIDVVYYGSKEKGLKYDLVVNPGGKPSDIKLKYSGADKLEITSDGTGEKLIIKNSIGDIIEGLPKVYQNINGKIVDVKAEYKLDMRCERKDKREKRERSKPHISCLKSHFYEVSFELETYNSELPLVIDPWATYYSGGGGALQSGGGLCADGLGNVIFTGQSGSTAFPTSPGAFQTALAGGQYNSILVKFSITGARIFGTFFGRGYGTGVAADGNNDILLTGIANNAVFPTKNPAGGAYFQGASGGGVDAYIAKFTPVGLLVWSTFYGGSGFDQGLDVISDASNNVIFVGTTASTNFPVLAPYQAALSGTSDAFIVKLNSNGVRQWATYYGGSMAETAVGVDSDAGGNIFFTGNTSSTNFPTIAAFQGALSGGNDAYAAKLNGATGFPLWSTYYGGTLAEWGTGVAVDALGNCIIVGGTQSTNNISSGGANQIAFAGANDAFVAKFNPTGARLWGTYHGGPNQEVTGGCAVDSKNNIYWYGEVEDDKPNASWISVCAYQNTYNGIEDHLISSFNPNGKLLCTTAVGGPAEEDYDAGIVLPHYDIAAYDPYLYITAHVRGGGYPVSAGAFQTIPGGSMLDAFVNQLCLNICQQQFLATNATANKTIVCTSVPINLSSTVNNACDTTGLRFKWTLTGATPSSSTISNPVISYATPGYYSIKLVVSTPCQKDSVIKTNYIIVNPCTMNATATTATVCSSTCANITATGSSGTAPYTYSWNTGGNAATINVCPPVTTDYTVKVTDAAGNYAATTTTVFVHPLLAMTSTSANGTCTTNANASVSVTSGTAPYTYSWSNGQTTANAGSIAAGNYTVTVTDAKGCMLTKTFVITSSSPVNASFTYSSVCVGTLVNFVNTGTSGTGATYNWTISTLTPSNVSGTTNNFSYTFLTAGSYNVFHQVQSAGCLASLTNVIKIINCSGGPTATATGGSACPGSCANATSSAAGGTSPYTYSWNNGSTTQNISPCPVTTTTYTVTIRDTGGNTSTASATITINPAVTASITPTNINCSGGTGSASASGTSGTPAYTYTWSNGGNTSNISNLISQIYTVTITDSKGCTAISTTSISSPTPLVGQFVKGTANCIGCACKEWVMVNASGGTVPYSYTWPDTYTNRYKNQLCPGAYSINVKDKNGCSINLNLTAP